MGGGGGGVGISMILLVSVPQTCLSLTSVFKRRIRANGFGNISINSTGERKKRILHKFLLHFSMGMFSL